MSLPSEYQRRITLKDLAKPVRWLVQHRSKSGRWVYVLCALALALLALIAIGEAGIGACVPEVIVLAVCVVQFVRPTILGWFVLIALFCFYTIEVATQWSWRPRFETLFFLALGGAPALALLISWPRSIRKM